MNKNNQIDQNIQHNLQQMGRLTKVLCLLVLAFMMLSGFLLSPFYTDSPKEQFEQSSKSLGHVNDFKLLPFPDTEEGRAAAYGQQLITETYKYLGPESGAAAIYSGNNLACSSCHLQAGTKAYAAPYVGLTALFPRYIGREDKVSTLEERINGCFERSMNGRALAVGSVEMHAIVSYIKHISQDIPVGHQLEGQGFVDIQIPNRAADIVQGKLLFKDKCMSCHGEDGSGLRRGQLQDAEGYLYPALWGMDSYNDGAGMSRLLTAARFLKGNMPLGASFENPILSDEEAYDLAAYMNSNSRPEKAFKELDYPNLKKKPKDTAYGPYADQISEIQHKYGPFNF